MAMSAYMRDLRARLGHRRVLVPAVGAIIRDDQHRVLLVQQRDDHVWATPGGAIELEDTPASAVVREVLEETGLVVVPSRIAAVYGGPKMIVRYPNGDETQYISVFFECEVRSGALRADGDEVEALRYFSREEASQLTLTPWLAAFLDRLFDRSREAWFEAPGGDV